MATKAISLDIGDIIFIDGYKGDKTPRFGQVRYKAFNKDGHEYILLYRDKDGSTEGGYRNYHVDGLNNARKSGLRLTYVP